MSSSIRWARRLIGLLAVGVTLACGAAFAAETQSSSADRERFVAITRNLEKAPLDPSLKGDREWALKWLTEAPDVAVTVCQGSIGGLERDDYAYSGEVLFQYMFAMAAAIIEHPDMAGDANAIQLAGAEGALNAYQVMLGQNPAAKSSALDSLLQARNSGKLPAYIEKATARCSAGK